MNVRFARHEIRNRGNGNAVLRDVFTPEHFAQRKENAMDGFMNLLGLLLVGYAIWYYGWLTPEERAARAAARKARKAKTDAAVTTGAFRFVKWLVSR